MIENENIKELNALVSLLDEPNDDIYLKVKDQILLYGPDAIPFLEEVWDNSFNDLVQERSETIIHDIQFKIVKSEFREWSLKKNPDLLDGLFLLSKYKYPDINFKDIKSEIEVLYKNIWLEFNDNLTALEKIKVFNHIFYDIHHFKSNRRNLNDPGNYFLKHLLDTKKGIHLTLGSLYILLAQRLDLPVFGVDLPHHFILAYIDPYRVNDIQTYGKDDVLFYINPFFKGSVFTKSEIDVYLKQMKLPLDEKYYTPTQSVIIIQRTLEMLTLIYKKNNHLSKGNDIGELLSYL